MGPNIYNTERNCEQKIVNEDIIYLSQLHRKLNIQLHSEKNDETKNIIKTLRNRTMTEIHNILKHAENEKIKNAVKDFESITNNNNERMYEAVKRINKLSPKSPLLIQSENGTLTINAKEKADTIAKYF